MTLIFAAIALMLLSLRAEAADISVVGLFPGKAVLVVDGAPPKTYSVGNTVAEGVRLVASDRSGAIIESNGKRQEIAIGEYVNPHAPDRRESVSLQADAHGHYVARGQINGVAAQMLVDTGATLIAIPAGEAMRLGIDYRNGRIVYLNTANGMTRAHRVTLDTVKVGDIELSQVDAVVQEQGLPFILLGMSFLSRTAMHRDGQQMVLTRRY